MLKRALWDKLKEKLVLLPAENRLGELKVLLVSTTDTSIIKEISELIGKAKIEAAELPWREKFQNFSIGSRLKSPVPEEGAAMPKSPELEQLVTDIPLNKTEEDSEVSYKSEGSDYDSKGYFSEDYVGVGGKSTKLSSDAWQPEQAEEEKPKRPYVTS